MFYNTWTAWLRLNIPYRLGYCPNINVENIIFVIITTIPSILYYMIMYKRLWYYVVGRVDGGLEEGLLWLPGANPYLFHKMMKRHYQIIKKIKVIVVHLAGHDETARCFTMVMEITGMLVRDEIVHDAVDEESRGCYFADPVYVSKSVFYEVF